MKLFSTAVLYALLFASCRTNTESTEFEQSSSSSEFLPKVRVAVIDSSAFNLLIMSNGVVEAAKKADLRFEHYGLVKKMFVNDGDIVKKGKVIACQDSSYLKSELSMHEQSYKKAELDIKDIILGSGYAKDDSVNIPREIIEMATIRSGKAQAENQLATAKKKLASFRLVAPFDGIIASVSVKEENFSGPNERVCTIIDNTKMLASFLIMESEVGIVRPGDAVVVSSVASPKKKYAGVVQYINPMVDKYGLVLVKATIENPRHDLLDGMSIDVVIKRSLGKVIALPKQAVIERQRRNVVFLYTKGRTVWKYVETGHETSDSVQINKGLSVGDVVITHGHADLAHDVRVQVISE